MDEANLTVRERAILGFWREGLTDTAIMRKLGCCREVVQTARRRQGLEANGRVSRIDDDELRRLHAQGWTDRAMREHFKVRHETVARRREILGLAVNGESKRGPAAFHPDRLIALYSEGLGDAEIARRLGVASATVSKWRWRLLRKAPNPMPKVAEVAAPPVAPTDVPRIPEALRPAVRSAFAITPRDPRILSMLEPFVALEMQGAAA